MRLHIRRVLRLVMIFSTAVVAWSQSAKRMSAPWPPPPGQLRVIIDADAANEIDDQYAIVQALGFPERLKIEGIVAAHYGDFGGPSGIDASQEEIERVVTLAGAADAVPVYRGAPPFAFSAVPPDSEGVQFIIKQAMNATPEDPLWLVLLGPATNGVAALMREPRIADRVVVFWHGRTQWPVRCWNYNVFNDIKAARWLFESAQARFVLFDAGTYLRISKEETARRFSGLGKIGAYLHDIRKRSPAYLLPGKSMWDLGDITALLDPASVEFERVAAPDVNFDLSYDFSRRHGEMVRIHHVNRDRAFDLLEAALQCLLETHEPVPEEKKQ